MQEQKTTDEKNVILVVGDWVIDEYWFLVRHHSEISSHTGFVHYRVSSTPNELVRDLCSAGHVTRVLYEQRKECEGRYRLVGIGKWCPEDTETIKHLIHSREKEDCAAATASFQLGIDYCSEPPDVELIPIRSDGATVRVVRLYHQERGGLDQINRVDWEPQREETENGIQKNFWGKLPPERSVKAIVVHDLGKGVVSDQLVKGLKRRYKKVPWCVRRKNKRPDWLNRIHDCLELLVIGPELSALLNPWESLLSNEKVTLQALEMVKDLPGRTVVLLSDRREVVVRLQPAGKCLTGRSIVSPTVLTQLGWSSALFGALAWRIIKKDSALDQTDLCSALYAAEQLAGVLPPGSPRGTKIVPMPAVPTVSASDTDWAVEENEWKDAMRGHGIIARDGESCLDVWRSSTYLPGYVTVVREKQQVINRIARKLIAFKKGSLQTGSLGIMLQADPGAGKTYLAKCLAKAFGFSIARYDITQMVRRDDLTELFDGVATKQANENQKILVFIDEINAKLDAGHVYGSFLAPLEEGVYVRRGSAFSLKPCVWVFAGTKFDEEEIEASEKLSDFMSRMTMIESIDYQSLKSKYADEVYTLEKEARLEQVYLGVLMIQTYFSDIQRVSREVLEQFYKIDPERAPARRIRRLAAALRNVQYGVVTRKNCHDWDVKWESGEEELVKLQFR